MSLNLPEWLSDKKEELARNVEREEQSIVCAGWFCEGFNECARLLLTENRRVMKLNAELMQQLKDISETIERRKDNGKSSR